MKFIRFYWGIIVVWGGLFLLMTLTAGCIPIQYYAQQDVLRYNHWENEYSYAHPEAQLRFNHIENRWEFAR